MPVLTCWEPVEFQMFMVMKFPHILELKHDEVLVPELAAATSSKVSLQQLSQMHLYNPLPISSPIPASLRT